MVLHAATNSAALPVCVLNVSVRPVHYVGGDTSLEGFACRRRGAKREMIFKHNDPASLAHLRALIKVVVEKIQGQRGEKLSASSGRKELAWKLCAISHTLGPFAGHLTRYSTVLGSARETVRPPQRGTGHLRTRITETRAACNVFCHEKDDDPQVFWRTHWRSD